MSKHYDWQQGRQVCPRCGWAGLGSEAELGETFRDGAEYHCPKCERKFGFVELPLLTESISDARAPTSDRAFAENALRGAVRAIPNSAQAGVSGESGSSQVSSEHSPRAEYEATAARARDTGFWIGVAGFAVLGLALHQMFRWLTHVLDDEEFAYYIIAIPAFCAFLIVTPIQNIYTRIVATRFCKKHGHDLEHLKANDGHAYVLCRRCYIHLRGAKMSASHEHQR